MSETPPSPTAIATMPPSAPAAATTTTTSPPAIISTPPLPPLPFLIHSLRLKNLDAAAACNRLLTDLLADQGRALLKAPAPPVVGVAYVPRKRRREEKCTLCAEVPQCAGYCPVCGCAACLKKLSPPTMTCPDCRERFHVECFPSSACPGCALAKVPDPVGAYDEAEERRAVAYLESNVADATEEAALVALVAKLKPAGLVRLYKAVLASRQALLESVP